MIADFLRKFFDRRQSALCLFAFLIFCFSGCSVPNLEGANCSAARDSVSRFYWLRFGTIAKEIGESPEKSDEYLSKRLISQLESENKPDYFSPVDDPPKAFRVGVCREVNDGELSFQLLFFWKSDTRSEQREANVKAIKENNRWLINSVEHK